MLLLTALIISRYFAVRDFRLPALAAWRAALAAAAVFAALALFDAALAELDNVAATDWKLAGVEWIERRRAAFEARKARAMDDGVAYE